MKRTLFAAFAAVVGSILAMPAPSPAAPQGTVKPPVTSPLPVESNPLVYIQRYRGPKDEILRTLSLFADKRAMLTTRYLNNSIALVQTGTWKREAKPNSFTVLLTKQNGKPMTRAAISFIGSPKRGGGTIAASGKTARNYGGYGLTMVPRAEDELGFSLEPKLTEKGINDGTLRLEAVGIKPLEIKHVQNAIATREGDVFFWTTGETGGYENEGQTLYRFSSLIGKPRKLAAFPFRITKVVPIRAASGRPALVVSLTDTKFNKSRLALVDPIRETRPQLWENARLIKTGNGKISVSINGNTRTFALDSIL